MDPGMFEAQSCTNSEGPKKAIYTPLGQQLREAN